MVPAPRADLVVDRRSAVRKRFQNVFEYSTWHERPFAITRSSPADGTECSRCTGGTVSPSTVGTSVDYAFMPILSRYLFERRTHLRGALWPSCRVRRCAEPAVAWDTPLRPHACRAGTASAVPDRQDVCAQGAHVPPCGGLAVTVGGGFERRLMRKAPCAPARTAPSAPPLEWPP